MKRVLALGTLCLLTAARPAAAEWHFTPMVGLTFSGNTSIVDLEDATRQVHGDFGGAVSVFGSGVVGFEGLVTSTPGFFKRDRDLVKSSRSLAVMGNAVLTAPRRWTEYGLRPFVSGGFGVLHASVVDAISIFRIHETMSGFNLGGGAMGFLTPGTGLRFDLRYYSSLHRSNAEAAAIGGVHLRYMSASVGLVFRRQ